MRRKDKDKINKVLVIRTDRMGDVLLNIPAIRALKQSFNSFVVILVNSSVKELPWDSAEVDQILAFDQDIWKKNLFARLSLLWKIRKMRFDLAVILNPTRRFHLLTYLAGISYRLGYNRKWGFLLTDKIEDRKSLGQKHEVEYNLDLVRSIGAETDDLHISVKVDNIDKEFIEGILLRHKIKDDDSIVAIHPHSSNPAKCWPKENFAYVADALYAKFSAKVMIVGGLTERSSATELISLTKHSPIDLSGKLTLKQLAAFFQRCALLISNDSGPVHIAAACGTPCVVIFGRNIAGVGPRRWAPWGNGHAVLHKDPGCNPCLDRDCPYDFKCLSLITSEEVLTVVERKLIK